MAFSDALAWALAQEPGTRAYNLAQAYTGGTRRVTVDGRTVEYASLTEMERVLSALHAAMNPAVRRGGAAVARVGNGWR